VRNIILLYHCLLLSELDIATFNRNGLSSWPPSEGNTALRSYPANLGFVNPYTRFALPAFPGAEGFGANAKGGCGGIVCEVTNLNDSGSSSLRSCIEKSGAHTVVFRVGGTIQVKSRLRIQLMMKATLGAGRLSRAARRHKIPIMTACQIAGRQPTDIIQTTQRIGMVTMMAMG
jgi:hypothetical protein